MACPTKEENKCHQGQHRCSKPERHPIPGVKNLVAVASGKGGVGKTTVAVNLALALFRNLGTKWDCWDADVLRAETCRLCWARRSSRKPTADKHIIPVQSQGLKMISMGLLNPGDKPMIWRRADAAQRNHAIFCAAWSGGELDYLIIDLPPGTGDVQLTLIQTVAVTWRCAGDHAIDGGARGCAQSYRNVSGR